MRARADGAVTGYLPVRTTAGIWLNGLAERNTIWGSQGGKEAVLGHVGALGFTCWHVKE